MSDFQAGLVAGIVIGVLIGVILGQTHQHNLSTECEKDLPRDQNCIMQFVKP